MKQVTFGDKALFMGDEAADALLAYAALLAEHGHVDTVAVNAVGPDGNLVEVVLVLEAGVSLLTESADDVFNDPDNSAAVQYMAERSEEIRHPLFAQPSPKEEMDYEEGLGNARARGVDAL